jgi:hypothetical protein
LAKSSHFFRCVTSTSTTDVISCIIFPIEIILKNHHFMKAAAARESLRERELYTQGSRLACSPWWGWEEAKQELGVARHRMQTGDDRNSLPTVTGAEMGPSEGRSNWRDKQQSGPFLLKTFLVTIINHTY